MIYRIELRNVGIKSIIMILSLDILVLFSLNVKIFFFLKFKIGY